MNIKKLLSIHKFNLTSNSINDTLNKIIKFDKDFDLNILRKIISFIDLTSLEGNDTREKIKILCYKSITPLPEQKSIPSCAAVCVYPVFISFAKGFLKNSDVKLATVGTSFPSGQYQQSVKLFDVEESLKDGADEIDIVISRGEFLSGNYEYVYDEIKKVKNICTRYSNKQKNIKLKVILEVGELESLENIWKASIISMYAGADFIKTSTGKVKVNATPEAAFVMVKAIKDYYNKNKKRIGFKPAGGIRTAEDALKYYYIVKKILGEKWLSRDYFRIGASSLLDNILIYFKNK